MAIMTTAVSMVSGTGTVTKDTMTMANGADKTATITKSAVTQYARDSSETL